MTNREDQIAHLQIVQGIIKRQAQSSFFVKGWSITLVTLIFAIVSTKGINPQLTLLALLPALLFWYLDTIYVRQERLFRHLHDAIVQDMTDGTAEVKLFEIKPFKYKGRKNVRWRNVIFSRTVCPIPLVAITLSILIAYYIIPIASTTSP